ncbi:hypothetical protein [Streptomyces rubiginosohelvolus]
MLSGIANEYSVTPWNGDFALVNQDTTAAFSAKICVWTGCDPYGPFSYWAGHDQVYYTPEAGPYGTYGEEGQAYAYNAHVHPALASGDTWTLSYNVNSFDSRVSTDGAHYRDPSIYKPRFVSFRLVESSTLRSSSAFITQSPSDTATSVTPHGTGTPWGAGAIMGP